MPRGVYIRSMRPIADRFWEKIDRPADPSGCWIWRGYKNSNGYGVIGSGGRSEPNILAHRLSYHLNVRPIVDGEVIRHYVCNNPPCVNPAHLAAGSQLDNMRDMAIAGSAKGERRPNAKLTSQMVESIRRRIASGQTTKKQIAAELRMDYSALCKAVKGTRWGHVSKNP